MGMMASAAGMIIGGLLSYAMTPKDAGGDVTNYDLLRKTQEQADADAAEAKARQDEAKRREELRTQQMYGQDIKTSERGANKLGVKEQSLGSGDSDGE